MSIEIVGYLYAGHLSGRVARLCVLIVCLLLTSLSFTVASFLHYNAPT
jgi:hypothetical protein